MANFISRLAFLSKSGSSNFLDQGITLRGVAATIFAAVLVRWLLASLNRLRLSRTLQCRITGPRYPHKDPFFGLDYILENARKIWACQFAQAVSDRFHELGSTYFALVGFQKVIHTVDPVNYETIMKTRFDDYIILPHRSQLINLLFGPGISSNNGEAWKKSRSLMSWTMGNLNINTGLLEKHASALAEQLRTQSNTYPGQAIDFGHLATAYTYNVAACLIFGISTDKPTATTSQFATDFASIVKIGQALTIFILQGAPFIFRKQITVAQEQIFNVVDTCVQQALAAPKKAARKHDSVLEGLARQTTDPEQVRSEALNMFLAGHDTIKIALTELMWHLVRNPEAWRKLRCEVEAKLGGEKPSLAKLREMTYLKSAMNEASRLNPTLSVHGRRAIQNTVLPRGGGPDGSEPLLVQKGTYVAYSNYALHRNPTVFGEDVNAFRPDRWADISPGKFEYLGFGAGPRHCPGKEVGWGTVAYAVVRLAQEFETLAPPPDDLPWEEAPSFSFYNKHGCHMVMKAAN